MSRSSRKHDRRRRLNIETLSERICLAVDAILNNGALTVSGGVDDDSVWIGDDGQGTVSVRDLGTGRAWEFADVRSVSVTTGGGADSVTYRRESGPAPLPELHFETGADSDKLDVRVEFSDEGDSPQELALDVLTDDGDDDVSVALLLPAVQKVREAAARTKAALGDGNNRFELRSQGVGQVGLDLTTGEGNDEVLIGLLLPAVQKVREAAARINVNMGDGNDRFGLRAVGVSSVDTTLDLGAGDDDASIALLLPAVQKVRESAARTNVVLGSGADNLRLQIRGYDTVETEIDSDADDSIDDGSARGPQRPRR